MYLINNFFVADTQFSLDNDFQYVFLFFDIFIYCFLYTSYNGNF